VLVDLKEARVTQPSHSLIILMVSRWSCRLIQIFAFYVIFHGHYSPGGGFQGGALLAASILLLRMSEGKESSQSQFPSSWGIPLGVMGVSIFAGVGCVALVNSGSYLDYGMLPFSPLDLPGARSLGILVIEVGVGLAVMATLVSIFDDLSEGGADD
jgi:multicomponent Na+:H+ antiporter subunit B